MPSDGGKVTPALFDRFKAEIAVLASEPNTFWTDQFHNEDAVQGYMGIGRELLDQTGGAIDAFCGAVGTGGMLRGVSRALRDGGCQRPNHCARALVLARSDARARRRTPGRGDRVPGTVPPHMADQPYDEARAIDEAEARDMAKQLAREEGLLVGTSSGLNIAAAIRIARELGPGKTVATVAVDTGLKYLAGDLFLA